VALSTAVQALDPDVPTESRAVPRWLFALTTFFGSFLLFQVQPMVARLALPDLGGAPAVWNSAMLVYQALLLAGYAWAHWLHRFPVRRQVLMHLVLLGAACFWLPIGLVAMDPPTGSSVVLFVPVLLLASVGPVILAVSAQAPLMQGWFAAGHGTNPYPLYAASNLGSFTGLLAYPLVVEPMLRLGVQRVTWSIGYAVLIALVAGCGLVVARVAGARAPAAEVAPADGAEAAEPRTVITRRMVLLWLALSAVPSGLMLSTTTHLSTDIMAMPLLWAIPLGLYLLSFTVAFADRRRAANAFTRAAPALLLVLGATALLSKGLAGYGVGALSLVTLFAVAIALHSRLYDSRPSTSQLTTFYLTTAVGGCLGGLFCGLVAPLAFDWVYEHPLLVIAAALLVPLTTWKRPAAGRAALVSGLVVVTACGLLLSGHALLLLLVVGLAVGALVARAPRPVFVVVLVTLMLMLGARSTIGPTLDGSRDRSYFGVYTVAVQNQGRMQVLIHGGIVHGMELTDPGLRDEPTMYYGRGSGIGEVLGEADTMFGPDASVGVVGLGAGTLACYKQPGQTWQFFEIDPLVVEIARDSGSFHFLDDCAPDADMVVGDARLELGSVADDSYDVLAIDAFSSDAIPMHLMTREAFDLYDRVTRGDGVVLVHITNRYLHLLPVLGGLVSEYGWHAASLSDHPSDADAEDLGYAHSLWVALSRDQSVLDERLGQTGAEWKAVEPDEDVRPWTDDYASVLPHIMWDVD
jgi:hypothetical protein